MHYCKTQLTFKITILCQFVSRALTKIYKLWYENI
jgi:hypothetical protein